MSRKYTVELTEWKLDDEDTHVSVVLRGMTNDMVKSFGGEAEALVIQRVDNGLIAESHSFHMNTVRRWSHVQEQE